MDPTPPRRGSPPTSRRPRGLEDAGPEPSVDELRRQQQREASHAGLGTEGQRKGAAIGVVVGALLGTLLLVLVGVVIADDAVVWVVLALMGAAFGAVAGGVYGGSRLPEVTNETLDENGRPETQPADDLDP